MRLPELVWSFMKLLSLYWFVRLFQVRFWTLIPAFLSDFYSPLINAFLMLLFLLFSFLSLDHIFPQCMKVSVALWEYRVKWERQKKHTLPNQTCEHRCAQIHTYISNHTHACLQQLLICVVKTRAMTTRRPGMRKGKSPWLELLRESIITWMNAMLVPAFHTNKKTFLLFPWGPVTSEENNWRVPWWEGNLRDREKEREKERKRD